MDKRMATGSPRGQRRGALCRVLLLCALVGILLVAGTSHASYLSADDATDEARVAAGIVEVDYPYDGEKDEHGNPKMSLIRPSDDGTESRSFDFTVSNRGVAASEVAIKYDISVTLKEFDSLPDGVTIELKREGEEEPVDILGKEGHDEVLEASGTFAPGEEGSHGYSISFKGDFNQVNPGTDYASPVSINVTAEQID